VPRLQTGIYVSVWKRLFGGCHRDQVAIQDFDSNTVFIQKKTHDKFSSLMKGLMILHEVFIHLEHKNSNDLVVMETNARARVKGLYEKPGFNKIVISALSKSSHKSIDGILSPWASLVISRESVHAANWAGLDQLLDYGMSPNVMINKGIHACSVPLITYALGEFTLYYPDPNFKILLDQLLSLGARLDQKDPYGRPASSVLIGPYFGYAVFQSLVAKGAPLDINQSACYPSSPKSSDELTFLDFYQGPYSSSADTAPIIDWLKSHGAKTGKELARKCSPPIDLFDNHNNVTDQCYFYLHDATVADDNPEVNNTRSVN
jgi:hypothetical protein